MYAFELVFSDEEVLEGIEKQFRNYKDYGFGGMAVILKKNDELTGSAVFLCSCDDGKFPVTGCIFQK